MNKLLHGPMAALRSESTDAEAVSESRGGRRRKDEREVRRGPISLRCSLLSSAPTTTLSPPLAPTPQVAQTLATIACIESLFELDPAAAAAEETDRQEESRKGERLGKGGAEVAAPLSPESDAGDRAVTSREPAGASAVGRK